MSGDDRAHVSAGDGRAVTARAPAKLNLELVVGGVRPDGYHDLATVFHAVSVYESVTARAGDGLSVVVTGRGAPRVPTDGSNLAIRAAALLAERTGVRANAALSIAKQVPVAGGMAGGSADAAATLVACDALWGTGLTRAELIGLGAELGADVPFCLTGGTAVGTGRGDQLTPALARGEFHWLFALAEDGLSTPAVYAECDRLRGDRVVPEPRSGQQVMQALRQGSPDELGAALRNDLQDAACSLRPVLRRTLEVGIDFGALGGVVSGSGPTVAFLARTAEHALDLAVALTASGAVADVRRATGPVPGARVVEPARR